MHEDNPDAKNAKGEGASKDNSYAQTAEGGGVTRDYAGAQPGEGGEATSARFEMRKILGEGGMGVVYRAYDKVRRQDVAFKSLLKLDGGKIYRFKQEFRSLAGIVHDNLVTLYELHSDGDKWFFTMELVEGVSLLEFLRPYSAKLKAIKEVYLASQFSEHDDDTIDDPIATPMVDAKPQAEAGDVPPTHNPSMRRQAIREAQVIREKLWPTLLQLARGIHAIHQASKLHCDIKPSNILVDKQGRVVVCDFGLITDTALLPRGGKHVFGTPIYMSPEQAAGKALSPASDWYSVGVVLYEILTGMVPFESATSQDTLSRKQVETVQVPQEWAEVKDKSLQHLCMRLLSLDPQGRPNGEEILAFFDQSKDGSTKSPARPVAPLIQTFVGREKHLAKLQESLATSREGKNVSVFVHGLSGMGKSSLIQTFLDEAAPEAVLLQGRCHQRESVPYKALDTIVDSLSNHMMSLPADQSEKLVPRDISSLARLFPVLQRVAGVKRALEQADRPPADPQELRTKAFGALRVMITRLAEQKQIILYIDDLQWGDMDSAPFLKDLIHHPLAPPLLMLGSYRSDEADDSPLLRALLNPNTLRTSAGDLRYLPVESLSPQNAKLLAQQLLGDSNGGDQQRAEKIVGEARGNPMFIAELTQFVLESGLEIGTQNLTLNGVIADRVARLPDEPQKLLAAAAVAGRPVPIWVLAAASGLKDEASTLAKLQASFLVRTREVNGIEEVETYHDRIRETVAEGLSQEDSQLHHRHLAQAFEEANLIDAPAMVEHWLAAGEKELAIQYARQAAEEAEQTVTFHRAAYYLGLVLNLAELSDQDRRALQVKHADALRNAGSLEEAADLYLQAAEDDSSLRGTDLRRRAVESLLRSRKFDRGLKLARGVLREIGLKLPSSGARSIPKILLHRIWYAIRGIKLKNRDKKKLSAKDALRLDVFWSFSSSMSFVDPFYGMLIQMQYLGLALKAADPYHFSLAMVTEIPYQSLSGHKAVDKVNRLGEMAQKIADTQGDGPSGSVSIARGLAAFLGGNFKKGFELNKQGEQKVSKEVGFSWQDVIGKIYRTGAMVYLGMFKDLALEVPLLVREAGTRGHSYMSSSLRVWRSNVAWLVLDDPEEALWQLKEGIAQHGTKSKKFLVSPHYFSMVAHSQISLYQAKAQEAWDQIESSWNGFQGSSLKRLEFQQIESHYLRARCALALASVAADRRDELLQVVEHCAQVLEKIDAPWGNALLPIARAGIAAQQDDRDTAVALLTQAIEACTACHMPHYAASARMRLGQLQGGEPGQTQMEEARQWMQNEGVKNPDRMIAMFVPGFGADRNE